MYGVGPDGRMVGEDGNHFFCSVCGEHGDLTCCDHCPRVFHEECLVEGSDSALAAEFQTNDDPWFCPSCVASGKLNSVEGKKPNWEQMRREKAAKKATKDASKRKSAPMSDLVITITRHPVSAGTSKDSASTSRQSPAPSLANPASSIPSRAASSTTAPGSNRPSVPS
ncbi:unnamed protein product, partial [Sphacelaria rigidula]